MSSKAIWNFLKNKGLSDYAVAGIMGNLQAESALNPKNLQNSYQSRLGYTDDSYTAAVDRGSYSNFAHDSAGYGLAQWTFWSRKQALLDYAKSTGCSIGDLTMQLEFLWSELQGYKTVIAALRSARSVREASDAVLTGYEKPADQSEAAKKRRAALGQAIYAEFAGQEETKTMKYFDAIKVYQNGSTTEPVYSRTDAAEKIGSLDPWEKCDCIGVYDGMACVIYNITGTRIKKSGWVKWLGGIRD